MPYAIRKIRGKDLYKVWNTETGEVKSSGSTKKDAKSQVRLLYSLEKKEGGALKADQIKDVIDYSYDKKTNKAPDGYAIDKDLSDSRVKVYKDLNSDQVIVAHRGSSGWKDWLDNANYITTGNIKDSKTYKKHQKKHEKALDKYGAENVISVGHSRAGKYVEELNKEEPVKEVLTYNKAVGIHDIFQKNPKNQTDIRSGNDLISSLIPFQSSKNKVVTIPSNNLDFLKAHGTSSLSRFGNKLIGKGFKEMRVGDMRKFVKAFKRTKYGETWTGGAKYGKKQLTELIKPMLKDDDIDEMIGGSIWTDFIKDFSSKHGLKYACSLSKYKEPLKKAYKLFKDKKDWFEPMKIDVISGTDIPIAKKPELEPKLEPNIKMVIEEKEIPIYNEDKDNMSLRQTLLETFSADKLKAFLLNQHSYQAKEGSSVKELALDIILIEAGLPPRNSTLISKAKEPEKPKTLPPLISKREELLLTYKIAELKDILAGYKVKGVSKMKKDDMIKAILAHEYTGSGILAEQPLVLSGGNIWTDFVKDYAKSYNTTYGCALSDGGTKSAYKLFKDGKQWYFPKVSATIETQTDDFIELTPTKAPENVEPVINRIEEKIKEMEKIGASKGAVSYSPSTLITDIAFVNLMKKYGGSCIVNNIMKSSGIDLGIEVNSKLNMSEIRFEVHYRRLGEALGECISRGVKLILIPLSLRFGSSYSGHANMLIFRPFKRLVERYEPHGLAYENSVIDNDMFNNQLKTLFEKDLTPYIGAVRYRPPDEYCPNLRGFQSLESDIDGLKQEGGGFCSMWSFFVAEMTFINPDKSTKEILDEVYDISKSDPAYLKSVIRGYVVDVEKGLDELLKVLGSSGFTFKNKKMAFGLNQSSHDQVLTNKTALEKWLLDSVFDTKKYSDAPPMYEPLPDVIIKEKSDVEKLKQTYFDKMRGLNVAEIKNIFSIYGLKTPKNKRDDLVYLIIKALIDGDLNKYGANGITDIDVILDEEIHKKKGAFQHGLATTGYFKKKVEGGTFNLGKSISKAFKPASKALNKAGKNLSKGIDTVSQGLSKINPMMIALNDKKTSKLMSQSGKLTNDTLLPAVVAMGKPVYDATAMAASTAITGNPIAGKMLADTLWDNMVAKKGIDPRDRQTNALLGAVSGTIGNLLGTATETAI
jgi:hypothetical protein